jgi:hypothetical protein
VRDAERRRDGRREGESGERAEHHRLAHARGRSARRCGWNDLRGSGRRRPRNEEGAGGASVVNA